MKDFSPEIQYWSIDKIIPYPLNNKIHTDEGVAKLAGVIAAFGVDQPIVVDENGVIIKGHKRRLAAIKLGLQEFPVVVRSDLSEAEKRASRIADNRVTEDSQTDEEALKAELAALVEEDFDMALTAYDKDELAALVDGMDDGDEESEKPGEGEIPDTVEPRVKLGEVWKLGRHYIACCDCTIEENVRKLLGYVGDREIDMIFTDPPYSVSCADKNASLNAVSEGNRIQTPIENDHLPVEETANKIWFPAFSNLFKFAKPGCVYYVTAPQGGDQMMMMMMMLKKANWLVKHELIWVKNNHVLGRADYHYKHEPIIYGWKLGTHYFRDSRSEFSVWNFDKPQKSDLHPTMKPTELIQYAMLNSSRDSDLIADFFLGSGSALIAAEQMQGDRTVVGFELSPEYCTVILNRYESLTGQNAVLAGHIVQNVTKENP